MRPKVYKTKYRASVVINLLIAFAVTVNLSSCFTTKKLTYFQDMTDTGKIYIQALQERYNAKIKVDDVVGIDVYSLNGGAAAPFNLSDRSAQSSAISGGGFDVKDPDPSGKGYRVARDGTIDFVGVGPVQIEGLTVDETSKKLEGILNEKYLRDAIVKTRILNYKITILGEVGHPALYTIPASISVVDAIALAGDITLYGNRNRVLLTREDSGGIRKSVYLNLKSSKIFESPYYYLRQNDILYVPPERNKAVASDALTNQLITLGSLIFSVSLTIYSLIKN